MTGSAMPERTASASPVAARARAGLQSDSESRPYLRPSLRLSGIVEESIVDGPGLRFVLFTQGCPHGCKGCHNPETHSLEGGFIRDVDELLAVYDENPLLAGVTFSGGEPFLQAAALCAVAERVRARGGDVVTYTGYTYESLLARAERGDASEIARLLDAPIMTTTLPHDDNEDIEYCTDPELIDEKFGDIVDLVIDGGIGGTEGSTVVDCTNGEPEIIRQGLGWLDEG